MASDADMSAKGSSPVTGTERDMTDNGNDGGGEEPRYILVAYEACFCIQREKKKAGIAPSRHPRSCPTLPRKAGTENGSLLCQG